MQIAYYVNKEDLVAFQIHYAMNSSHLILQRMWSRWIFLIMSVIITAVFSVLDNFRSLWLLIILLGIGSVLWAIFYPKQFDKNIRKQFRNILEQSELGAMVGSHSLEVDEKGLYASTEHSTQFNSWKVTYKIAETDEHVMIYLTSMTAHVIPNRDFANPAEWQDFITFCQEQLQKVNNAKLSTPAQEPGTPKV